MLHKFLALVCAVIFFANPAAWAQNLQATQNIVGSTAAGKQISTDAATPIRVAVTAPVSGTVSKPGPGTPGWEEICRPEIRAVRQVLPSDKKLAYYGRWDKKDAHAYRTDRGAAYLKFNFTGDYVAVHLQNTGAKIWWRSSIDGDAWQRFRGDLISPLTSKGKHTLVLERDTETAGGITSVTGITLAADGKLLPPPKPLHRRMEFVGDSILAGAFALGTETFGYLLNESSTQSFGPLTARKLGAEYSIIATSGEGVVHNYRESAKGRSNTHSSEDYARLLWGEPGSRVTGKGFQPQVVVLNPGANDFTGPVFPEPEVFKAGYRKLILQVRNQNPKAVILCLEPVPFQYHARSMPLIEQVVTELQGQGDLKLRFIPVNTDESFLRPYDYADGEHPLLQGHAKLTHYLSKVVAGIMGWE